MLRKVRIAMRRTVRPSIRLLGFAVATTVGTASPGAAAPANMIAVAYVAPKEARHEPLYAMLKGRGSLERMRELLSPFRLPDRLLIKVESCDGVSNAWYDKREITICYEYLDDIMRNAPADVSPDGVTRIDAIVGPFYDVILHEFAHALFDLLKVPVLGREEDAADQVSTYIMLRLEKDERRRLIVGTAYSYTRDFPDADVKPKHTDFAGEHGTPQQRFFNLLCTAYGADKEAFGDFVAKKQLPESRAEGCADEYKTLVRAFRSLIGPHIDRRQARKLRGRMWLPESVAELTGRPTPAKR
jgi:hypothetical protein